MHFFGGVDNASSIPVRANLRPRTDDRSQRTCRTLGAFAVYMHDYGLDQFDSRFRDDGACWNVTAYGSADPLIANCSQGVNRNFTWWCNKRPNNPCVFNCPNQVCKVVSWLELQQRMLMTLLETPQVPECELDPPRPRASTWSGTEHSLNMLPRWPNTTGWPSAWDLHGTDGKRQYLQYNISDGWATNLVSSLLATNASLSGEQVFQGVFNYMGSRRADFPTITRASANFTVPPWPQTQYWMNNSGAPGAAASRNFYFATQPFNTSQVYNTSYRVWGNFTVYVTHLSNNDTTISCFNSSYTSMHGAASNVNCTLAAQRQLQCPFTFRCFSPEMAAASGPRCLDDFDNGYNDTDNQGTTLSGSPNDVYGKIICLCFAETCIASRLSAARAAMSYPSCGEFCPGCPTCPMIQCWQDDSGMPVDSRSWDAAFNSSAVQDDRVPYM